MHYVVFLFSPKIGFSEPLSKADSEAEAEEMVYDLRKQKLPAFYATQKDYLGYAGLKRLPQLADQR